MRFIEKWKLKWLNASEARSELVLRGANLATWDWNVTTGHVVYNERWAEMRGYQLAELEPNVDAFIAGIHPDDLEQVQLSLSNHFSEEADHDVTFRAATKTGGWIWVLGRGRVFERDKKGAPIRMCGTELDITERKRIESETQQARFITDNLPSMIAYWDKDQICRFANKAYHNWFGKNPVGHSVRELLGPFLYEKNLPQILSALNGETQIFERDLEMKSEGTIRHIHVQYVPDFRDGQVTGFSSLVTDVTEIKNAQMAALAAKRDREHVLAVVSHDLKNPLSVVWMCADLLSQDEFPRPSEVHEMNDRIKRSVRQMQALIDDLLDFGKIQAGTFTVTRLREPAAKLFSTVFESMRPLAEAKNQRFELEIPSELPDLDCDFNRISQVLSNVLGNAVKFTPKGGTVKVTATVNPLHVLVAVTDSGPGIEAEHLVKIFDRFWQATEKSQLGSGLGLSIAKSIVAAHGSKIWAESDGKNGSTISFLVPLTAT